MKNIILIILIFVSFQLYSENRVALVIGNGDYDSKPLRNAVNDANDMSSTLKDLGFEVILVKDSSRRDILRGIRDFSDRLDKNSVGLFYYAGHGVQVNNINYLIPVNADIIVESDIEFEGVPLDRVIQAMEDARTYQSLIFLDACRDNPYSSTSRSGTRGLTVVSADTGRDSAGSLIAFATSPGSVAEDGTGDNGTFTSALLKYIKEPGLEINQVMTKVRADVMKLSNGNQKPWTNVSLTEEFYFSKNIVKQQEHHIFETLGKGALEVNVLEACKLYIDGVFYKDLKASSKSVITNIKAGNHVLEFKYESYNEKQLVNVSDNEILEVLTSYELNPMFILSTSSKELNQLGVEVYLDNKKIGKAPLYENLPVGKYTVSLRHPAIDTITRVIEPQSKEKIILNDDNLIIKKGKLVLMNVPLGTKVSVKENLLQSEYIVDNDDRYQIPGELIVGKKTIKLEHQNIQDTSFNIDIIDKQELEFEPDIKYLGNLIIESTIIPLKIQVKSLDQDIPFTRYEKPNKDITLPEGKYLISIKRIEDINYTIKREVLIEPFETYKEVINKLEYSIKYQLEQLYDGRDYLENLLTKTENKRANSKAWSYSLLIGGLSSIAYSVYSYFNADNLYNNYISSNTTEDATKYRTKLESTQDFITYSALLGGGASLAGLITTYNIPKTNVLKARLRELKLDIEILENKMESK